MELLDLPISEGKSDLRLRKKDGESYIFDMVRNKWLVLQPEEVVRQLMVLYLIREKGYPKNRFSLERGLKANEMEKRSDILVYGQDMNPFLIVECKSPYIAYNAEVCIQNAIYNLHNDNKLESKYFVVTNGLSSVCCLMNYDEQAETAYSYLTDIPNYKY